MIDFLASGIIIFIILRLIGSSLGSLTSLVMFFGGITILSVTSYLVGMLFVKNERTLVDLQLPKNLKETEEIATQWLTQKRFKITENDGKIKAVKKWRFMASAFFELKFDEIQGGCLFHGEFYVYSFPTEVSLKEKSRMLIIPRRRGFELMNEFLDFLKLGK